MELEYSKPYSQSPPLVSIELHESSAQFTTQFPYDKF